MKKILFLIILLMSIFFNQLLSKSEPANETTITLSIAQDPSFGFYPFVNGVVPLNNDLDFTFYGIFWTQDALAGKQGGIGLLTEFGVGMNFKFQDGAFFINPNLGLGNGKFQSGGGRHIIGDNLAISLFAGYSTNSIDFTIGGIYWKGLRREEMITPYIDQIEYTASLWYKLKKWFNFGLYVDHYLLSTDDTKTKETNTSYFWVGPSFKFIARSGATVWFTLGPDLVEYLNNQDNAKVNDYYKLVASFPF